MTRKIRARTIVPAAALSAAAALGLLAGTAGVSGATVKVKVEKPPTTTVTEAGSSLLYPLWNLWAPGYGQKFSQVSLQTAAGGSGKGIAGAIAGTLNIGSSDAYLSTAQKQSSPTLENIPLAISAQEVYYKIPRVTAHLKLSGKILAGIFTGKITKWNTSAISSANPGVTLPTLTIVPIHRSDGSGDTFIFTTYLSDSTKTWSTKVGYNTTVTWPAVPGGLAGTGNSGVLASCAKTTGCVAYIGISYQALALGDGLTYAQLQNGKGQYVMPTNTTIDAEAAGFTKKTPATGAISMIDGKIKTGYPIINYEYGIVNKKQSSASQAKAVRSLLEWCINPKDGNSASYLSQVGFRPLPTKVIKQSVKQINAVK